MTKDISDEIPFELPQGWAWARLGVIFDVARGGSPRPIKAYITTSDDGLNWIKIGDATIGSKYIFSTEQKIRPDGLKKTRAVYSGDLLLTNSMSFGHPYILKTSGCIHDGWLVLHPLDDKINKEFFYYLLSSKFAYSQFAKAASGGVVRNLNTDKVIATIFPLPSPSEQKRIVAKIEELFAYADKIGKASDGSAQVAQRLDKKILDLAIRGQLVPQDPNDEPASELIKRIETAKKATAKGRKSSRIAASDRPAYETEAPFDIPDSWEWVQLNDLGRFVGGHTPSIADSSNWENGNILWVTSKDMKQKYISNTGCMVTEKGASELHLLPPGSLLMVTRSGILRRTFPIALAAKPLTINQDQRALEFYDNNIGEYIYYCLKSLEPIVLRDYRKTGTTVESIIWEKFIHIPIPLPPINEQRRIVAKVEEFKAMIRNLVNS